MHIVSPCNKARISNFHPEFQEFLEMLLLLKLLDHCDFLTRESGHPATNPELALQTL